MSDADGDLISRFDASSPEQRERAAAIAREETAQVAWIPNPGPQCDAYYCDADELFYGGQAGGGKGQPMSGLVLTPFGFREMAQMRPGSAVCCPDGSVAEVLSVHPLGVRQLYRVSFADQTSVEVTGDHIWLAWRSRQSRKRCGELLSGEASARLWTTEQLRAAKETRFRIPITHPVSFNDQARYPRRPIHPYVLGVLLGDGSLGEKYLRLTTIDVAIAEGVARALNTKLLGPYEYSGRAAEYRIPNTLDLQRHFKKWDLLEAESATKFIPEPYLVGNVNERWQLLQGLMDTDGWSEADGDIYYRSISRRLSEGVADLARSLGAFVTWRSKTPTFTGTDGTKKNGQLAYTLRLKFRDNRLAFSLDRKKALCGSVPQSMSRPVVSIEPTRRARAQCIRISHPAGLYLTNDYIVTHNTDLGLGLALTAHRRALILRRINKDAVKLVERVAEILGSRAGYNGQLQRWKLDGGPCEDGRERPCARLIEFAGCEYEEDKQRFKGDPHDLIYFDEGTDFLRSQYRFIVGWNRSADPNQRCRVVVGSNPPTTAEGLWVIRHWAPWLDPMHPNPARPGELRWFTTGAYGEDIEVDGRGPHLVNGEAVLARSRTYIPAKLADNPDLHQTGYGAVLAGLPEELRRAYRDGDFGAGLKDDDFQVIPTAWIEAAQRRWRADAGRGVVMTAIGLDVAQGGADKTVLAARHGVWYAPLVRRDGHQTRDGSAVAAAVVAMRRDRCPVVVDVGGGWGGDTVARLKDNGIPVVGFNGAKASVAKTRDGQLAFFNKRAEAWWRLREELDPGQDGGAILALPPDASVKADLAAPRWELTARGIKIEDKDDIRKRLGRSPDEGDAIVMCLSEGARAVAAELRRSRHGGRPERANVGYAHLKQGGKW